jgi:hypothetical protein
MATSEERIEAEELFHNPLQGNWIPFLWRANAGRGKRFMPRSGKACGRSKHQTQRTCALAYGSRLLADGFSYNTDIYLQKTRAFCVWEIWEGTTSVSNVSVWIVLFGNLSSQEVDAAYETVAVWVLGAQECSLGHSPCDNLLAYLGGTQWR